MSFASKMALRYIKTQKKHSVFIILSIVSALTFVTVIFTLFSSFYSSMLSAVKSENPWHTSIYDITQEEAEKVSSGDMISEYEYFPSMFAEYKGTLEVRFSPDIYDPATYIRESLEEHFDDRHFEVGINDDLLNYELIGIHAKATLVKIIAIVYAFVLFIIFCARFVIDTAFEISSKEREVQFGILASLGASKKQITRILIWQGIFLSVIGIPLGLLLGIGAGYLIYSLTASAGIIQILTGAEKGVEVFSASPLFIIIAAVTGFVWVLLSAYGTGKRFSKKSPVQSIKQSDKKVFKVKKSLFFSKLFGFSGNLASKNIRREKKSFVITALALSISFTVVSLFGSYVESYSRRLELMKQELMLSQNISDDYSVLCYSVPDEDRFMNIDIKEGYRAIEERNKGVYVTSVQTCYSYFGKNEYLLRSELPLDEDFRLSVAGRDIIFNFVFINKLYYDEIFATSSGVDYDTLVKEKGFIVCETEHAINGFEGVPLKIGDDSVTIDIEAYEKKVFEDAEVKFLGSAQSIRDFATNEVYVTLIGAEDYFYELNGGSVIRVESYSGGAEYMMGLPRNDGRTLEQMDNEIKMRSDEHSEIYMKMSNNNINSIIQSEKEFASLLVLVISVMVLVSLIAVINQINIISTGVINRRRELASLRALGMTKGQLFKMLALEIIGYVAVATLVSFIISSVIILLSNISMDNFYPYSVPLSFTFSASATLICAVIGFVIGIVTIHICTSDFSKNSIAEEMKTIE